jgi:hypothetical protein
MDRNGQDSDDCYAHMWLYCTHSTAHEVVKMANLMLQSFYHTNRTFKMWLLVPTFAIMEPKFPPNTRILPWSWVTRPPANRSRHSWFHKAMIWSLIYLTFFSYVLTVTFLFILWQVSQYSSGPHNASSFNHSWLSLNSL